MKEQTQRRLLVIIPATLIIAIFAIIGLFRQQATAVVQADTPPPSLPAFTGKSYVAQLEEVKELNINPIPMPTDAKGWTKVMSETFTTTLNFNRWSSIDNDGATNGEYKWAAGVYTSTGSITDTLVRAISGGVDGVLITETQGYPANVDSWLILGPFSTENASQATLTFDYWFDATFGDEFSVLVSTNGTSYNGLRQNGGTGGWNSVSYSLNDYLDDASIYVAFVFTSDGSGNDDGLLGAYLDNVDLYLQYPSNTYLPMIRRDLTPTPTNTPTSTPTPTPTATPASQEYYDDFDNPASNWDMVRTNADDEDDWHVTYREDTGGLTSLQIEMDTPDNYILVSPLVQAPERPFNIETKAQFFDTQHRHIYGVIFGGDWNGQAKCPVPDYITCFTRYYWLRVEWDAGNGNPFIEFMLRRVDGHSPDNDQIGTDLIGWTRVDDVHPNGWNEWDIFVDDNGDIKISINDRLVASTNDTLIQARYFGLLVETQNQGDARVKFDYFKINEADGLTFDAFINPD